MTKTKVSMKNILFLIMEYKHLKSKKAQDIAYSRILKFLTEKQYKQKTISDFYRTRSKTGYWLDKRDKEVSQIYNIAVYKALRIANIKSIKSFVYFVKLCFRNSMLSEITRIRRYQAHFVDREVMDEDVGGLDINYLLFENKYDYEKITSDLKEKHKDVLDSYIAGETFEDIAIKNKTSKQNIHQTYGRIVNKLAEENWNK